ncbi:DUF4230 domain-containing protein [Atopobium fossor]|uniref:DUF4230 domain-containing protein n=1 Tax=Atopobium fossor TaxID=39487 RepID=UPI00041E5E96|nr:DUF4230 domain-containing protein [Atopobium fossor]
MLRKIVASLVSAFLIAGAVVLPGCKSKGPDFSNAIQVAKWASYDCYFHDVAKGKFRDNLALLFGHEIWYEYDAKVQYGIDSKKVKVGKPHQVGSDMVVTVQIPKATILGRPAIDPDSINFVAKKDGLLVMWADLGAQEKQQVLNDAQDKLEEKCSNNTDLLARADKRAQELLKNYVEGIGDELGEKYVVEFEIVE